MIDRKFLWGSIALCAVLLGALLLFGEPVQPGSLETEAPVDPVEAVRENLVDVLMDGDLGNEVQGADGEMRTSLQLVQVSPIDTGGHMVTVQFVAGDNFTANARRETMVRHTGRAMAAIYKTEHDVRDVTMQAFFPVVDGLGNSGLAKVYEATLFRADAMRANLDDPDQVDWSSLWSGGFIRDDF